MLTIFGLFQGDAEVNRQELLGKRQEGGKHEDPNIHTARREDSGGDCITVIRRREELE